MFHSTYQVTDPRPDLQPCGVLAAESGAVTPVVGAYSNGLLMVVDDDSSKKLLTSWAWLLGNNCLALLTTGFGDVFFWSQGKGVHFLEVQRAAVEFVDSHISWVVEEFLTNSQIIESVLRKADFERLVHQDRPLNYREAFVLEPWQMLGGTDQLENYKIRLCNVYLDLVGQTHDESR